MCGPAHVGPVAAHLGRIREAEEEFWKALTASEDIFGKNHPETLTCITNLASLLETKGDVIKALDMRLRVIEVREQMVDSDQNPQFAIDLNNLALRFRKLGRLWDAELLLRRALSIDERVHGATHPKIPHRLNNLCTVLVMQDKLTEANQHVARAWHLKASQRDLTSARILFVRMVVALLDAQPVGLFLGQLKTLLTASELPDFADVTRTWDISYFIEHLRPKLSANAIDLLTALAAALNDGFDHRVGHFWPLRMKLESSNAHFLKRLGAFVRHLASWGGRRRVRGLNDRNEFPKLDHFDLWKNQPPVALDTPWVEEPTL